MRRAIVFKNAVLILDTWDEPNESGNWLWFNSFEVDSVYVTDKPYDKCVNGKRVKRLRRIKNVEGAEEE